MLAPPPPLPTPSPRAATASVPSADVSQSDDDVSSGIVCGRRPASGRSTSPSKRLGMQKEAFFHDLRKDAREVAVWMCPLRTYLQLQNTSIAAHNCQSLRIVYTRIAPGHFLSPAIISGPAMRPLAKRDLAGNSYDEALARSPPISNRRRETALLLHPRRKRLIGHHLPSVEQWCCARGNQETSGKEAHHYMRAGG
jgi:hypothetical protein